MGKLHKEELNDLYSSPNIVRVIKSRMKWTEDAARMGGVQRRIQHRSSSAAFLKLFSNGDHFH